VAAAAATTATAAVAATAAALDAGPGLVDGQRATAELLAVELLDGRGGPLGCHHLDEAEAARAARVAVFDHRCVFDLARLREQLAQFVARRAEVKVPDVKSRAHLSLSFV
jgi:hypothetical protein